MNLRVATIEDIKLVTDMALKFAHSSPYKKYIEDSVVEEKVNDLLMGPTNEKIVLLYQDLGMLAGIKTKFTYGTIPLAVETAWWVEPDQRGQKAGGELRKAFEYWASQVDCSLVVLSCLDDEVGKYYERNGYGLYERAYMKEL